MDCNNITVNFGDTEHVLSAVENIGQHSLWHPEAVSVMLELYEKIWIRKSKFPIISKASAFRRIAVELTKVFGMEFTEVQVTNKFKRLEKSYKEKRDKKRSSGSGYVAMPPYSEYFDRWAANDVAIAPALLMDCRGNVALEVAGASSSSAAALQADVATEPRVDISLETTLSAPEVDDLRISSTPRATEKNQPAPKRRRQTDQMKMLNKIHETLVQAEENKRLREENREKNKERRHKERIEVLQRYLERQ